MLRIWFNRTYATNSHVIAMLRANADGRELHVIGTHTDPDSPVLVACDEHEVEPVLEPADYIEWAVEFARKHDVQVLIPRFGMAELADARERFAAIGTSLACPDGETVRLFDDKPRAYRAAAELGVPVPPHHVVCDAAGLRAAHEQLSGLAESVVMKPTVGVGGAGYRVITTGPQVLADFAGQIRHRADLGAVCDAMDAAAAVGEPVPRLLVMPYLTGPEISVDVLAARDGSVLAAIGRGRSRRRRLIVDDGPARDVAATLTKAHRVAYLSNTQVRYWQGPQDTEPLPYLLELNTRISGGLFQTALAGVNLPWDAVRLALGEDVGPLAPRFGAAFTTISSLVPLP
ncbi:MAG: ATP-grasp domain-containing protein [Jatrophihabitantaceae bacterium]